MSVNNIIAEFMCVCVCVCFHRSNDVGVRECPSLHSGLAVHPHPGYTDGHPQLYY